MNLVRKKFHSHQGGTTVDLFTGIVSCSGWGPLSFQPILKIDLLAWKGCSKYLAKLGAAGEILLWLGGISDLDNPKNMKLKDAYSLEGKLWPT